MKRPNLIRDPADWARSWGWINRKQADELRNALRLCTRQLERDAEESEEEPPACATEGRRVLAKRVHRYPKGG